MDTLAVIRPAHRHDFSAIVELARVAGIYLPEHSDLARTHVVCVTGEVVAFSTWQVVCDEATLLGVAVHPDYRHQGIATQLLTDDERRLRQHGISRLFLEVRASNRAAQQLYHQLAYRIIAERKGYYPTDNGREAALVMAKYLVTDA